MSWRNVLRALGEADGPIPARSMFDQHEVETALRMGLITTHSYRRYAPALYALTALGRDYLAGRVVEQWRRPGGRCFAATWLRALPQGVQIDHGACPRCGTPTPASRAPEHARQKGNP